MTMFLGLTIPDRPRAAYRARRRRHSTNYRGPVIATLTILISLACGVASSSDQPGDTGSEATMKVVLSPDGTSLALSRGSRLWLVTVRTGDAIPLTPADAEARNPSFSPDGSTLVYQARESEQWDLWMLDLESGESHQVTDTDYHEVEPVYWPDGLSVVFAADRADSFDIWELHLGSGALRRLTGRSGRASFPSVSGQGEVVYANETDGRWSLYLLRTGVTTLIANRPHPILAPSWRPGGGVVVITEQPDSRQSNLVMVLLDDRPLFKSLTSGEQVDTAPVSWVSPSEFIYAANGEAWKRPLGSAPREAMGLELTAR